jgi:hypothetical protein
MGEKGEINSTKVVSLDENSKANNAKHDVIEKKQDNSIELILKENLSCEMYHFILNVYYSSHLLLKIIFTFFTILGFGLASYMTINLILSYLEYNVITTIRVINDCPAIFPKVTICNRNPFTTRYAYEFLSQSNFINLTELEQISKGDRNHAVVLTTLRRGQLAGKIKNFQDDRKKIFSHSWDDILLSCLFDYQFCNSSDFKWEWDNYYGNCYSFNFNSSSNELKKSYISGSTFGLQLELYVNFYERLMFFNSLIDNYGLVIRVDNVSHVIDYSHDGIFIASGFHTYISLERQIKTILPSPYSDCYDFSTNSFNSDLYNLITNSKYDYTQKFCLQQCFQELLFNELNCSDADFALLRNISYCINDSQIASAYQIYTTKYLKNNYIQNFCIPKCPLECNSTRISYTSSFNELILSIYVDLLEKNPNLRSDFINRSMHDERVVSQSIVKLNIFYDSLSYTSSTESPQMDIVSLIANIGGNMGLFMGVCLFSIGEIAIALIEVIFHKLPKNKKVNTL